jgi:hypothetical protein
LAHEGRMTREAIAKEVGIVVASVYRLLALVHRHKVVIRTVGGAVHYRSIKVTPRSLARLRCPSGFNYPAL